MPFAPRSGVAFAEKEVTLCLSEPELVGAEARGNAEDAVGSVCAVRTPAPCLNDGVEGAARTAEFTWPETAEKEHQDEAGAGHDAVPVSVCRVQLPIRLGR